MKDAALLVIVIASAACPAPRPAPPDAGAEPGEGEGEGEPAPPGRFGDPCIGDDDCASGLCTAFFTEAGFAEYCTAPCFRQSDCEEASPLRRSACVDIDGQGMCFLTCDASSSCRSGGVCLVDFLLVGGGACYYGPGRCDGEADCPDGTSCTWVLNDDFVTACLPEATLPGIPTGGRCDPDIGGFGRYCSDDADCTSGAECTARPQVADPLDTCIPNLATSCNSVLLCRRDGLCAAPCHRDGDCAAGEVCEGLALLPDDDGLMGGCRPARGSGLACVSDAGCADGEGCLLYNTPDGTVAGVCRLPEAGEAQAGERCDDEPFTAFVREGTRGCAAGACWDGRCAATCEAADDCTPDEQCVGVLGYRLCIHGASCSGDLDCADDERCFMDARFDPALPRCVSTPGTLATGEHCETDTFPRPCASDEALCGFHVRCDVSAQTCLPDDLVCRGDCGAGRCSSSCDVDADCGDPSTFACVGLGLVHDPFFGSHVFAIVEGPPVGRCLYAPGSRAPCDRNEECDSAAGERCRPFADRDGTTHGACIRTEPGELADGESCFSESRGAQPCASGICDVEPFRRAECRAFCSLDSDCPTPLACGTVPLIEVLTGVAAVDQPGVGACGAAPP